jgi:two-component system OmpR family response regulator
LLEDNIRETPRRKSPSSDLRAMPLEGGSMAIQTPRVLLIDDDQILCKLLAEYLAAAGLDVAFAHSGEAGVECVAEYRHDVVVLDVMLPDMNGIEVLRHIRRQCDLPVLMLTARGDDLERIIGLELGADDYLHKPCNPRELLARLRAVLRRTRPDALTAKTAAKPADELVMSTPERQATWRGQPLKLTSTEFDILKVLAGNAGCAVAKSTLAELVLGHAPLPFDRSIDMHISNLRQKLGKREDGRSPIQTLHGKGYQWILE